MTREEMLNKMELSEDEFEGYVKNSKVFIDSLNDAQLRFHLSSKRPPVHVEDAAKVFGQDATADDLTKLFASAPMIDGVFLAINYCCDKKYQGPLPKRGESSQ